MKPHDGFIGTHSFLCDFSLQSLLQRWDLEGAASLPLQLKPLLLSFDLYSNNKIPFKSSTIMPGWCALVAEC